MTVFFIIQKNLPTLPPPIRTAILSLLHFSLLASFQHLSLTGVSCTVQYKLPIPLDLLFCLKMSFFSRFCTFKSGLSGKTSSMNSSIAERFLNSDSYNHSLTLHSPVQDVAPSGHLFRSSLPPSDRHLFLLGPY